MIARWRIQRAIAIKHYHCGLQEGYEQFETLNVKISQFEGFESLKVGKIESLNFCKFEKVEVLKIKNPLAIGTAAPQTQFNSTFIALLRKPRAPLLEVRRR